MLRGNHMQAKLYGRSKLGPLLSGQERTANSGAMEKLSWQGSEVDAVKVLRVRHWKEQGSECSLTWGLFIL